MKKEERWTVNRIQEADYGKISGCTKTELMKAVSGRSKVMPDRLQDGQKPPHVPIHNNESESWL